MNVLALIPARGGSKGVPRKNLRTIAGRTLVGWSVLAARESRLVSSIVVSTDDPEIVAEAAKCGVPALVRPAALATDAASTDAVIVHAMEAMAWAPDLVVLLQPTVPVRAQGLVDRCIEQLLATGADSVFTGWPLHFVWRRAHPKSRHNGEPVETAWLQCNARGQRIPRQAFAEGDRYYHEDGSVFVSRRRLLRETCARLGGRIEVVETERTVDIDTEADLAIAEAMLGRVECDKPAQGSSARAS